MAASSWSPEGAAVEPESQQESTPEDVPKVPHLGQYTAPPPTHSERTFGTATIFDSTADAAHKRTRMLFFCNPMVEQAFAQRQTETLMANWCIAIYAYSLLMVVYLCNNIWETQWPWMEDRNHIDFRVNCFIDTTGAVLQVSVLLSVMAFKVPRIQRRLSLANREWIVIVLITINIAAHVFCTVRYAYRILGGQHASMSCTNADAALFIICFSVTTHIALPVRWSLFLVSDVFTIVLWTFACFGLDSEPRLYEFLMVSAIVFMSSYGHRSTEIEHRDQFVTLTNEKRMRAQAEHQLSAWEDSRHSGSKGSAEDSPWRPQPRPADAPWDELSMRSVPTTTRTGALFQTQDLPMSDLKLLGLHEHWLVKESELKLNEEDILGSGGFSVVVAATYCGREVAVKMPRPDMNADGATHNELRLLRQVRHPNIVQFLGACVVRTGDLLLVMELLHGKTLLSFIKKRKPDDNVRRRIVRDVCHALVYLHSRYPRIVHCDLKDGNIVVDDMPRAKLLDFGLARAVTRAAIIAGGSSRYLAPEALQNPMMKPVPERDVFSLGRVMYAIATGKKPLHDLSGDEILEKMMAGASPELDWSDPSPLLQSWRGMIAQAVDVQVSARITVASVLAEVTSGSDGAPERRARKPAKGEAPCGDPATPEDVKESHPCPLEEHRLTGGSALSL